MNKNKKNNNDKLKNFYNYRDNLKTINLFTIIINIFKLHCHKMI